MKRLRLQYALGFSLTVVTIGLAALKTNAQEIEAVAPEFQQAGQSVGEADDPGAQTVVLGMTLEEAEGRPRVTDVAAASPAWDAGIRKGDLITSIDGLEQSSVKSYVEWLDGVRKIVADKQDGQSLAVEINREDSHLELRARIPESRIEEVREEKKEENLAQQEQLALYPVQQPVPVPQQPVPYPAGGYGNGGVAIGIDGDFDDGGRGRRDGGQFGQAMAQLFRVNGTSDMTGSPLQSNRQGKFLHGADPNQQLAARRPNNNPTQPRPATINQGQGDTLQQRLDIGAKQAASGAQQGTVQQSQQQQMRPGIGGQQAAEVEQGTALGRNAKGAGHRVPEQPEGIDDSTVGMGAQVGTAMFEDQPRGLFAAVDVMGLPPGNYFVGISDESAIQAGGQPGGVPQNPTPQDQQPGNQNLVPQQQQQQLQQQQQQRPAVRPGAVQPGGARPRGNALFGGTEFFVNAQVESPDSSLEGLQDPSPNLEPPSDAAVPGVDPDAAVQNDNQAQDNASNVPGMNGTGGGGAFVRIGFLQVGQDGAGRLRQRVPNVRVDQIVGMAVVVHATTANPDQAAGAQVGLPNDGANSSLVAAGIIQLAHPRDIDPTVNAGTPVGGVENPGQQNPAAVDRRPPGQTSDGRIDQ